jgi:hypothetical protein
MKGGCGKFRRVLKPQYRKAAKKTVTKKVVNKKAVNHFKNKINNIKKSLKTAPKPQ